MHLCDIKLYQTAPNKKTQIQAHENDDNTLRIAFEIIKLPLLLIVSSQVMKLKKKNTPINKHSETTCGQLDD